MVGQLQLVCQRIMLFCCIGQVPFACSVAAVTVHSVQCRIARARLIIGFIK